MKKQHVQLSASERETLVGMLAKGNLPAYLCKRVTAIFAMDRGETLEVVAQLVCVTNDTVASWRNRYHRQGVAGLQNEPRPGRPVQIDGKQRAQITALACSEAPTGYSPWTLRLLAERVVELGYCETFSHTQVGAILKKTR